ncbi:MAG: hypothetical protein US60_C0026G0011 [Microgenomates group bacterium GW2011_GWC1_37_8]|nr:MAG: hypothetical protein US60_C0026G0011 [Microgenomates group bacterium GW2011_GWC1_37_8]
MIRKIKYDVRMSQIGIGRGDAVQKSLISGIRVNEFGMLVVDRSEREVGHKISLNYLEAKIRIRHALAVGKTVLLLPGTYDLLHAGHLVWFDQSLHRFTKKLGISREEVYVVVPFDNDKLTRIKKMHRHVSQGGKELYLRPIVNEKNRSVALANLPYVDLVMSIPSPLDAEDLLSGTIQFDIGNAQVMLKEAREQGKITEKESIHLNRTLKRFKKMILPSHLQGIREAFTSSGFLSSEPEAIYKKIGIDNTLWSNAAWQLICFLYKMDQEFFEKYNCKKQKVYRMISEHDGYSSQVKFIMHLAGIESLVIKEDYITSTTDIIRHNNTRNKMDEIIVSSDPRNYRFS